MAIWRVSNLARRTLVEREIWTHSEKGEIVREILFTSGSYLVVTEDDSPPEFEREAVPDGDGAEDAVDMNFCGYDTQLIDLEGGCNLMVRWPEEMSKDERQALVDAWDKEAHEGWENEDWVLDDTEVWFWGDLNIEFLEPNKVERQDITKDDNEGWISNALPPTSSGTYTIETVEKVVWPLSPVNKANWNGDVWLDEDGDPVAVARWKEFSIR
jgi:hypothetical protein